MKKAPIVTRSITIFLQFTLLVASLVNVSEAAELNEFLESYCYDCHTGQTAAAGLDLKTLSRDFENMEVARRWIRTHDRIASGEMPPRDAEQPTPDERSALRKALSDSLIAAERATAQGVPQLRRMTRVEYENTVRDLFDLPGILLAGELPADGTAHGFDKHPEALDISHVNVAKYLEAADHILDIAIATRPEPPTFHKQRISLANPHGFVAHVLLHGDGVLLKDKVPDPEFPPPDGQMHLDQGAHERWGSFRNGASVGLFRHEDESFHPYFNEFVAIYPGRYRLRTSLWSFQWDKGQVLPSRGTEAARLSIVQLTSDGRGGGHPSTVLTYLDAPSLTEQVHEMTTWLNQNETIGFNAASLVSGQTRGEGGVMNFVGPGISCDYLDVEGPLYDLWPPRGHQRLFGSLPIIEFKQAEHPGVRPPNHEPARQKMFMARNAADREQGVWTIHSEQPLADARRLLSEFLPQAFRRPVEPETIDDYTTQVAERLEAGDCFEVAMRVAYRNALVAPDFVYHIEPTGKLDDYALACRLSYLLWNSLPDEQLMQHAIAGDLRQPDVLHAEVERLLTHPRSARFVDDFLGQWLRLRQIAANDPDQTLYPEFSPYLQDSMIAETRAYFRELLDNDLDTSHLVKSDFVMVNQKLATHYGIPNVSGPAIRRVPLPADCPRGGLLTQASILKITANGTTTSPVPRGAFVIDRLLGEPPEPPPANVAAIEPDVRGAITVREQLAKHREHAVCASCHRRIDPPGFALESFDVIGGFRTRYRSIREGDTAERGSIDPFTAIYFKLGQYVDSSGELNDGRVFKDIREYQEYLATDSTNLVRNLVRQLAVYATGRAIRFSDRPMIDDIVRRTETQKGGIRTLLHELVGSPLFTTSMEVIPTPHSTPNRISTKAVNPPPSTMMTMNLSDVASPAIRTDKTVAETTVAETTVAETTVAETTVAETTVAETAPREFHFAADDTVTVRVSGWFTLERVEDLRRLMQEFPEARLLQCDFPTATATFNYSGDSDLFHNAKPEQVIERLNNGNRLRSQNTIGVKTPGSLPHEKLQLIEIPIVGLDCNACCLAVHDILVRVDGVEHATASFHDGLAGAWLDPAQTNRTQLEEALKQQRVKLSE